MKTASLRPRSGGTDNISEDEDHLSCLVPKSVPILDTMAASLAPGWDY